MTYIEVDITISPFDQQVADIIIANLAEIGFESFSETDNGLLAYTQEKQFSSQDVENVCEGLSGKNISISFTSKLIEDQNWNALWESNFEPITVEKFCRIRAPFHQSETGYNLELVIEPKMSFGTGHHQTTWLMVREMFDEEFKKTSVLDMGCGTGILAIIAEKLGAISVHAIDIDIWAVNNSIENSATNGCSKILVEQGDVSLIKGKKYDKILANINLNILMQDIHEYSNCLSPGGTLIVSGILFSDVEVLSKKAQSVGFIIIDKRYRNDWALIKFIKT